MSKFCISNWNVCVNSAGRAHPQTLKSVWFYLSGHVDEKLKGSKTIIFWH